MKTKYSLLDGALFHFWKGLVLLFPGICLFYLASSVIAVQQAKERYADFQSSVDFKIFIFDTVVVLGIMLSSIILIFQVLKKKETVLRRAKEFAVSVLVFLFARSIVYAVLSCVESDNLRHVLLYFSQLMIASLPGMIIISAWYVYLLKSKRIRMLSGSAGRAFLNLRKGGHHYD